MSAIYFFIETVIRGTLPNDEFRGDKHTSRWPLVGVGVKSQLTLLR